MLCCCCRQVVGRLIQKLTPVLLHFNKPSKRARSSARVNDADSLFGQLGDVVPLEPQGVIPQLQAVKQLHRLRSAPS